MRPAIISGCSAIGFAVGGWAVQVAFPHVEPWVGKGMLGVAGFLLILAFLIWLWGMRKAEPGGGTVQSSAGPNSPNLQGVFNAPVTIHAPQNEERPSGYTPDYGNLDGLIGALKKAGSPPLPPYRDDAPAHEDVDDVYAELREEPKGDLTFNRLNVRLYKVMGPRPTDASKQSQFDRRLNLEILDQVVNHPLAVWARVSDGPRRKIQPATLERAKFDHRRLRFAVLEIDAVHPTIYQDVMFNLEQVMEVWPL